MSSPSFYDLTKDHSGTLSAHDLFKYRLKRDSTIPSRGGQKEFEPDGTWMQTKAIESFVLERTQVIGEPRVEKLKNLVQGTWEPEKKLINVDKTGKFWAHMGFTDKRRNWLYPEEALFLMETSSLGVYEHGVPLSIQEAYTKFLVHGGVSLEKYQVFAHLRRLGFVVLRHEEQPILTRYEKQINMDKYMSKKSLKERKGKFWKKKKKDAQEKETSPSEPKYSSNEQNNGNTNDKPAESLSQSKQQAMDTDPKQSSDMESSPLSLGLEKRPRPDETEDSSANDSLSKKLCVDTSDKMCVDVEPPDNTSVDECQNSAFYQNDWSDCFGKGFKGTDQVESSPDDENVSKSDASADHRISFPNIAGKETLTLNSPESRLLPANVNFTEESFDVVDYRSKHPMKVLSRRNRQEEERDSRVRTLEFSFAEWTQRRPKVSASSWSEYKAKVAERIHAMARETPVSHLWEGEVTPLVQPKDATSFGAILNKLGIIQSVDNSDLEPKCPEDERHPLDIAYDVHLPDHRFKKSMPGTPNHRVCVSNCDSQPPGLTEIQQYWHLYRDEVPLHWAVVDSGEVAFYVFDNSHMLETLS